MALPLEKLDRSRPFGSVTGPTEHKIAYTQANQGIADWPYDAHGGLIEAALNDAQAAKLREKRAKAKAAPIETVDEVDEEPDAPLPPPKPEDDAVNLTMWLTGEAKYKQFEITKAFKARYHIAKNDLKEIARYLVEDAKPPLVARALVHPSILPAPVTAPAD